MTTVSDVRPTPQVTLENKALREAAQKLEAGFLAEMLKSAGLGAKNSEFGGGAGEDQFSSFLIQEQAMQMVRAGGIGLSQSIYEALKEQENER